MLEPFKASALYVVTDALLRAVGSAGELTLRDVSLGALGGFIDDQFLNVSVTGTAANPASIVAGGTLVNSTGTTAAAMTTDFGNLIAAITTNGRALVWIMRPVTMARVALVLGAAASDIPRTLFGIPIVASSNSPQQITLADAGEIVYADDGGFDISLSRQGTIEMESEPIGSSIADGSPAGPTPTSMVSLFQVNCVGVMLTRWLNWEVVRSGSVAYMPVTY
jgi:HK97 family phage major capsid protein